MVDVLSYKGRLPGVLVQIAPPSPSPAPLRLDVAGLVGFAERGPLDLPVLIEDTHQYQLIFGGDLPVAREGGQPIYAHLPGAVRAFFENGGRRCYVVRVAGQSAAANEFHLPGLFTRETGGFAPVVRPAAWEGGWSESVRVGTQLLSDPQRTAANDAFRLLPESGSATDLAGIALDLCVPSPDAILSGDLMRLSVGYVRLYVHVASVETSAPDRTLQEVPVTIRASADSMVAFTALTRHPSELPTEVTRADGRTWSNVDGDPLPYAGDEEGFALNVPSEASVVAGDLLRLTYGDHTVIYFSVSEAVRSSPYLFSAGVEFVDELDSGQLPERLREQFEEYGRDLPSQARVQVEQEGSKWTIVDGRKYRIQKENQTLSVYVILRENDGDVTKGFLRLRSEEPLQLTPLTRGALSGELSQADLLTFDLHVREGDETLEVWRGLRFNASEAAPTRFWLDRLARPVDREILSSTAEMLQQRSLRLGAGEPPTGGGQPFFLPLGMSELRPQWRGPLPKASSDNGSETGDSKGKDGLDEFRPEALFIDPAFQGARLGRIMTVLEGLLYLGAERIRPTGMYSLLGLEEVTLIALPDLVHRPWRSPQPPAEYEPPEGPGEEKRDLTRFWDCSLLEEEGRYEQEGEGETGEDQAGEDETPELYQLPVLKRPEAYEPDAMLAVQEALVAMCTASADRVAILSLPLHFDRRETLTWQQELSARFQGYSERPLSYAAAYHGWVRVRETTTPELAPLRDVPPDGAVCGMIAARELARGPWIAAANLALQRVVGLKPALSEEDQIALFNNRLNVLAQRPGRFVSLSAHTLSPDRLLFQLSVRRLLIYLRKYLLREGNRWVFETNNARLRQMVQASLERMLGQLVEQGGLAAFEIVTGSEVNTPNDYDQGRFIVAVKIAPTQPIEFITVVLLRTGDGQLQTVER